MLSPEALELDRTDARLDGVPRARARVAERLDADLAQVLALSSASAAPPGGRVKKNVDPLPTSLSAQTRPPWRCTIRWTVARPMPVPSNSAMLCSRWKAPKSFCAY